jgi:superoxide dismutase
MKHILLFEKWSTESILEAYSDDELEIIAKRFTSYKDFRKSKYYNMARLKGKDFLFAITSHMPKRKTKTRTYNDLAQVAKSYTSYKDFARSLDFAAAKRRGEAFLNKITDHMMDAPQHSEQRRDKALLEMEGKANACPYFSYYYNSDDYHNARAVGRWFLDMITIHMPDSPIRRKKEVEEAAEQYTSYKDFMASNFYQRACKYGSYFLKRVTNHMTESPHHKAEELETMLKSTRPHVVDFNHKYTEQELEEIAKSYNSYKDFRTTRYKSLASSKGTAFLHKIISHMADKPIQKN